MPVRVSPESSEDIRRSLSREERARLIRGRSSAHVKLSTSERAGCVSVSGATAAAIISITMNNMYLPVIWMGAASVHALR